MNEANESMIRLLTQADHEAQSDGLNVLELTNELDPRQVSLEGVDRIDLQFPKFNDGRAFSQAFLLRRRLRFKGEIRATGDVLIDQLLQMQRSGFDSAVLNQELDVAAARRQLKRFSAFYQGDAVHNHPRFHQAA